MKEKKELYFLFKRYKMLPDDLGEQGHSRQNLQNQYRYRIDSTECNLLGVSYPGFVLVYGGFY